MYFLPGIDPSGWTITHSVDPIDTNPLGSFVTVTLHGTKLGGLDFDYHISVSKTRGDILVRLDRANNTGKTVEIDDMDCLVVPDAQLGARATSGSPSAPDRRISIDTAWPA